METKQSMVTTHNMVTVVDDADVVDKFTSSEMRFFAILITVLSLVDIIGNLLIIMVYFSSSALRKVASRCLIIAVSIADINMGVVDITHVHPYLLNDWLYGKPVCGLIISMGFAGLAFTMWSIMCVSLERYTAVIYPLRYNEWMTKRHVYGMLATCILGVLAMWLVVLVVTLRDSEKLVLPLCAMHSLNYPLPATIFMNVTCVMTSTVIFYTNTRVLLAARKQARAIAAVEMQGGASSNNSPGQPNITVSDRKAAFMLITLSLVFTIAMFPGLIFIAIAEGLDEEVSKVIRIGQVLSALFMGLNGMLNIIIYSLFNKKFRQGLKTLLLFWKKSAVDTINSSGQES